MTKKGLTLFLGQSTAFLGRNLKRRLNFLSGEINHRSCHSRASGRDGQSNNTSDGSSKNEYNREID